MAIVLFDSNVLIDHTKNHAAATDELANYDDAAISVITWMEVAVKLDAAQIASLDAALQAAGIAIIHTNDAIMRRAAQLRATIGKKLPDCIIRATAELEGRVVVTRNPADFGAAGSAGVHVPYRMENEMVVEVFAPVA